MTADWITAIVEAAAHLDEIEGRHAELSESAARGLLEWCLNGSNGAGGGAGFSVQCVRCGTPYQHVPPSADSGGDYLSYLFACGDCKDAFRGILGTPASPGRPAMSAVDARIEKYRNWRRHGIRSHQPQAPVMPRPAAGRPSAAGPGMPVVGP